MVLDYQKVGATMLRKTSARKVDEKRYKRWKEERKSNKLKTIRMIGLATLGMYEIVVQLRRLPRVIHSDRVVVAAVVAMVLRR